MFEYDVERGAEKKDSFYGYLCSLIQNCTNAFGLAGDIGPKRARLHIAKYVATAMMRGVALGIHAIGLSREETLDFLAKAAKAAFDHLDHCGECKKEMAKFHAKYKALDGATVETIKANDNKAN